jgi:hypothetical protein
MDFDLDLDRAHHALFYVRSHRPWGGQRLLTPMHIPPRSMQVNSRSVLNAKCSRVVSVMNRCDALLRLRVARRDAVTNLAKPPASGIRTVLLKRPRAAIICTEITPQTLHHAADYYELNLAGTGLTEVPRSIEAFLNVEVLDLADNNVSARTVLRRSTLTPRRPPLWPHLFPH